MTSLHFDPWPFILCASYLIIIQYYLVTAFVLLKWTAFYLFSSVQSLSRVRLFATPWTAARQASLSITNSRSSPKPMCIELVMPSSHLILCRPLLLLPSIFPSIRVFSNESALRIRWPKYWSFSFNISPSNDTQDWSPLGWTGWISLQSKGLSRVFSNTTVQKHQFFGAQLFSQSNSHIHIWPLEKLYSVTEIGAIRREFLNILSLNLSLYVSLYLYISPSL